MKRSFYNRKKGTIVVSSNGIETVSERNVGDDIMADIEDGKISSFKDLSLKGIIKKQLQCMRDNDRIQKR